MRDRSSRQIWLFICYKTKLKKKIFLKKYLWFLQNIHYLHKKNFFVRKKSFENFFYGKNLKRKTEKTINENVKNVYLS